MRLDRYHIYVILATIFSTIVTFATHKDPLKEVPQLFTQFLVRLTLIRAVQQIFQ